MSARISAEIRTEHFDGFALIRSGVRIVSEAHTNELMTAIQEFAGQGTPLIFVDIGKAISLPVPSFVQGMDELRKTHQKLEVVLVSSTMLALELKGTPVAKMVQLYEQRDEGVRRTVTNNVLRRNFGGLQSSIDRSMMGAIEAGVKRWMGEPPQSVGEASASVDPRTDVVSVVNMQIEGGEFRIYLSSALSTLRKMAMQILKCQVDENDPAVSDGACELLNYLTAYFRQHLSNEENMVDTTAPHILPPDEIMELLNNLPQVHRVQTQHGHFDVWIEGAA